jgi:2-oxoglutarate dehydrogenase E1 component
MVQAPVFHVNGDDPEACVRATHLAYDYRQRFHKDVVLDMVCYRKYGHNESDDPSYTQPILYRKIREHKSVATLYAERLQQDGLVTAGGSPGMAGSPEAAFIAHLRPGSGTQRGVRAAGAERDSGGGSIPIDRPPTRSREA